MNALKHGIFAWELKVSDEESPEFFLVKTDFIPIGSRLTHDTIRV